ncbi:hypothetical protein HW130_23545 [Streptomyces sp. PKU-EA00015]|uniref:hypothetical protein n=1 Tax=Streptomyces sp. PKU-EA00015 TaxID=2748326 RepID=UPI0015A0A1C1|nr:hypothetical protein [Streptomyces sp. PKU-EA00015]NWF29191.1 hypothetical protein [Streptomyces sp. PKU-EA00015]
MPTQISLRDVTVARGDRLSLDGASLTVRLLLLDESASHLALGLVEKLEEAPAQWSGRWSWCPNDRQLRRFDGRIRRTDSGRLLGR